VVGTEPVARAAMIRLSHGVVIELAGAIRLAIVAHLYASVWRLSAETQVRAAGTAFE
jgi:hypothetical protein